ncbi:PAB1 binding protein [Rhodotorula kratochvilovae]
MADSLTAASSDLARKRSRSSSPSVDSAAKKANQAATAPETLEVDDEMPPATETTGDDEGEAAGDAPAPDADGAVKAEAPVQMNVDSSGIPAKPVDLPANPEQASQEAAAQALAAQTIQMRTLIVTQDASIIIGKQGKNIIEIREKSGAKITITEAVPGNPERIMAVGGPLDAVSKAFGLIVRRINDEPFDVPSVPGSRAVTIRFIIPNSRMGSVIGKGGSKIKEIQEASGAKLQASEAMLPGSSERVLSVSGVADAVHIAVYYVGSVLQENPPQSSRDQSYRPGSDYGRPPPERGPRPERGPGGPGAGSMGPPPGPGAQTQQLYIPTELVGSIIGKGGSKINEVRSVSACQIKIAEPGEVGPGGSPNERLVTITGQPAGIQVAVRMLYQRLEQEKAKQLS